MEGIAVEVTLTESIPRPSAVTGEGRDRLAAEPYFRRLEYDRWLSIQGRRGQDGRRRWMLPDLRTCGNRIAYLELGIVAKIEQGRQGAALYRRSSGIGEQSVPPVPEIAKATEEKQRRHDRKGLP